MPSRTRMKTIFLRGLLWLYLLGIGCVLSVEPGFLDFDNLPDTNFSCVGKVIGGYYADLETNCQMFHVCTIGQLDEPMDIRFLCLNGTVFDQETRVCERIDEVDCSKSEKFYSLNLELYGNTQPSVSEDTAETIPPIIIKASTTTTTTTTQKPKTKTTKFFTTSAPIVTTVTKVISAHHFPISNSDIRFNPEEINISLNPRASPSIRSKSVTYQQQVFGGNDNNKKVVVTTHTSYGTPDKDDFVRVTQRPQISSTQKIKSSPATPADINYGFTYHQTEDNGQDYTEHPHNYQYHHSYRHGQFRNQFKTTTYRSEHLPTTRKQTVTTYRTHPYATALKSPTYHTYRTEKPQRLQLPIPLLPTLPPLTFSSPAPFSLRRHIETKRYTNEHQAPPRIIISASASVSDNSGRRLNYSLGTIGVTPFLEEPPKSYDDYKDHDVVLDPFYHDVPKIKSRREKRQVKTQESEQAAVDVLKFLFDWYKTQQKSSTVKVPIDPEDITEINQQLAPVVEALDVNSFKESALFTKKNKFNIVGDVLSVTEKEEVSTPRSTPVTTAKLDTVDYVDDNYEAVMQRNITEEVSTTEKEVPETTLPPTTTTSEPTTTSKIMALMRQRAKIHQKRIMNENRRRYQASLNALRPKVRRRDKHKSTTIDNTNVKRGVTTPKEELATTVTTTTAKTTTPPPTTTTTASSTTIEAVKEEETEASEEIEGPHRQESQVVQVSEQPQHLPENVIDQMIEETKVGDVETHFEETVTMPEEYETTTLKEEEAEEINKEAEDVVGATEALETQRTKEDHQEPGDVEDHETLNIEEKIEDQKARNIEDNETSDNEEITTDQDHETSDNEEITTDQDHATSDREEITEDKDHEISDGEKTNEDTDHETSVKEEIFEDKDHEISDREKTNEDTDHETSVKEEISEDKNHEISEIDEMGEVKDHEISDGEEISEDKDHETSDREELTENKDHESSDREEMSEDKDHETSDKEETTEEITESTESLPEEATTLTVEIPAKEEEKTKVSEIQTKPRGRGRGRAKFREKSEDKPSVETSEEPKKEESEDIAEIEEETVLAKPRIDEEDNFETETMDTIPEISTQPLYDVNTSPPEEFSTASTDITEETTLSITESYAETTVTTSDDYQTIATSTISTTSETEVSVPHITPAETTPISVRRTRPPRTRTSSSYRKPNSRHRFNTEITSRPTRRKETETLTQLTSESLNKEEISLTSPKIVDFSEDVAATDAPLSKSANPTQAESAKESLHTTPLSMVYKLHVRKTYIFNCFGKAINKFYPDPRDCRLFHYCTNGYTKNQLLDMKFVCDLGTYFDEEKLICSKTKPVRCL